MKQLQELAALGQSVWIDYIRRSFVTGGELQRWIDLGLRGMTSNPTIFEKAIAQSDDYTEDLKRLASTGLSQDEIFTQLVVDDIRQSTDLFRQVYDATAGGDGYVSIEVNPRLANDTTKTIEEAMLLWKHIDRPNLMVKIPATRAGLPAITAATAAGINVNVTLIFSLERYGQVMAAYLAGLQQRANDGLPLDRIHSVASFFVSRVDTKVDKLLEVVVKEGGSRGKLAESLLGRAAVSNARLAYSQFRTVFLEESFAALKARGANLQRPLWASTSTKNPAYSDILYVEELIAPHTVNTMPAETMEAFLDHGEPRLTLEDNLEEARIVFHSLADLGISMHQVTEELEEEGVASFSKSFGSLMDSIEARRAEYAGNRTVA